MSITTPGDINRASIVLFAILSGGSPMQFQNHRKLDCLSRSLFGLTVKKKKKQVHITVPLWRESRVTVAFPSQRPVMRSHVIPDSKVHGANMGPTWVLSAPDGPHVGPMNLAIRDDVGLCSLGVDDGMDLNILTGALQNRNESFKP